MKRRISQNIEDNKNTGKSKKTKQTNKPQSIYTTLSLIMTCLNDHHRHNNNFKH